VSVDRNKAVVRQLVDEVFNQGNVGIVDELVAPDFIEHEELPPGIPGGREGIKYLTAMLRGAFPDFEATIDDIIAEDDRIVVRQTWSGTHEGEFMGIPATGKRVSFGVIDIIRIADDKCVEHWGQMDNAGLMHQLGVTPGPG
jgi:steroid delta-isomerase-like uncharacterized protein